MCENAYLSTDNLKESLLYLTRLCFILSAIFITQNMTTKPNHTSAHVFITTEQKY